MTNLKYVTGGIITVYYIYRSVWIGKQWTAGSRIAIVFGEGKNYETGNGSLGASGRFFAACGG
jgi:hypothetical protein